MKIDTIKNLSDALDQSKRSKSSDTDKKHKEMADLKDGLQRRDEMIANLSK
jgi:hypothetical protein